MRVSRIFFGFKYLEIRSTLARIQHAQLISDPGKGLDRPVQVFPLMGC